ncbi:MAG: twin-arginine translocation signal domain-containing protein, partial [Verrucomicrobia bacterium]|nr:twin-arginine translocation signal domain-containing protein [Verrucomicrobiota bacterium]
MRNNLSEADNTQGISRRNFLKTSAAAASAPFAVGLPVGRAVFAAGRDTIKLGLIGC